jgi:C1A family cysteine protease
MWIGLLCLVASAVADEPPPSFGTAYYTQGVLNIPYAELTEPFTAFYDGDSGSSRIDYYGDMVQTLQLSGMGDYGSSLKIAPVTTDTVLNSKTCLQVNGSKEEKIMPQSILPDLTGFKNVGTEVVDGLVCEKWKKVDTVGEKISKYTMYVRWKKSPKNPKISRPFPVKYEMKGYNSLLGSHYDHYYVTYSSFSYDRPSPAVFEIHLNMSCTHFPGPGVDHVYTFNPMKEFIDHHETHVNNAWDDFKGKHSKEYDQSEHSLRKEIFRQNIRFIHSKNRANLGFSLSVNHLADRTDNELKALRGKKYTPGYNGGSPFPHDGIKDADLPEQFDWRLFGAVTPVKDQSVCGSCWSFGTTGAIEGAYFVKTGHLLRLSQQALIDCSWGYGNNGCDGGEDFRSYQWMMKHGGIPMEAEYGGYLGQDGYCHIDKTQLVAPITGYVNVTSGDETALKFAIVNKGPISVAIDAAHKAFSFYSNGVYYDTECKNSVDGLDHAVLAVGYGTLNGHPYWLVKNSWSNYWGNDGYVLMSRKDNNCGVMTTPTYVTM